MTKDEFLKTLEQQLRLINDEERRDILQEYEQHIEMKIESGLTEEEAIEDFGDIDELTREILDAYHINTEYGSRAKNFSKTLAYYIHSAADFLTNLATTLLEMSRRELGQLFIKFLGVLFFLFVCRFVLELCSDVLYPLIALFPSFIAHPLHALLRFIINLLFAIFSVYLLIFFIKKYILVDYQPLEPAASDYPTDNAPLDPAYSSAEMFNTVKQKTSEITDGIRERARRRQQEAQESGAYHESSLGAFCLGLVSAILKFLAVLILIPGAFSILGLAIACGVLVVFIFQGFGLFGATLIAIGALLVAIACFAGIFKFVFGGGAK